MMKKLSFANIIDGTLKLFPEYIKTHHYTNNDKELAYSFFYGFTDYVNKLIEKSSTPTSNQKIKQVFDLFNLMLSSEDEQLSTLAVTEILSNLVQKKKSKEAALKLLSKDGQKYLAEVLKYTGIED